MSSAGEYSGLLSNLYKKASDQNRPLILVLDNNANRAAKDSGSRSSSYNSNYNSDYASNNYKSDYQSNNNYESNYQNRNDLSSYEDDRNEDVPYPFLYLYQLAQQVSLVKHGKLLAVNER